MSTAAQKNANRQNARHSAGPLTPDGKSISSLNHLQHGLSGGVFRILPLEDATAWQTLLDGLRQEHHASTPTESILVENMAQHHWLSRRAQSLQANYFLDRDLTPDEQKNLALYLRYQTAHQRAFFKCLNQLERLRAERYEKEIGFERENRHAAEEARRQEAHEARMRVVIVRAKELEFHFTRREVHEDLFPTFKVPLSLLKDDLRESLKASVARKPAPVKILDAA